MQNELTKLFEERQALRESLLQLSDSLNNEGIIALEKELKQAQNRIKLLEATTNDPHALWANWLRGSVTLPVGIGDVREYQDRIKRLEETLEAVTDKLDDAWGIYMQFKEPKP